MPLLVQLPEETDWQLCLERGAVYGARTDNGLVIFRYIDINWGMRLKCFPFIFFVKFFAIFCGNFCIDYFSAIFCVKKHDFFCTVQNFSPKNGQNFWKNFAIVNITVKFCDNVCIFFFQIFKQKLTKKYAEKISEIITIANICVKNTVKKSVFFSDSKCCRIFLQ